MIARVTGRLEEVTDAGVLMDTGSGLMYELLVPAGDLESLRGRLGKHATLHAIHFIEGDPSHGALTPRLIGFTNEADRDFFRVFTTVRGIGVRKALRSLVKPIGEVAAAIAERNLAYLVGLPEIGKRTAERIVAELHDKVDTFRASPAAAAASALPQAAREAVTVLVGLGERRPDATALVEKALEAHPELETTEKIIQAAYQVKATGS